MRIATRAVAMNSSHTSRRRALGILGAGAAATLVPASARAGQTIRIGYQKFGLLVLLKARGVLEKALQPLGWSVAWSEFPGGIQLVEALQAEKLDFGVLGEAPPIFALASGVPLVYLHAEPPAPAAEAILVPKGSAVKTVADLAGKRVVVNKGSNTHYLLIKALEEAKVPYDKVKVTFVPPAGARAAFEAGQVDAWAIWDPFLASAQQATGARVLRDGKGLAQNVAYYVGTRAFVGKQTALIDAILGEVAATGAWANSHADEVVALLAPLLGITPEALRLSLSRNRFGAQPVSDELLASQQKIADTFAANGLIPKAIRISEARWERPAAVRAAAK